VAELHETRRHTHNILFAVMAD